ncbi:MAG: DEAD/DEAH box helicase, partial [Oscillospiraceae bacterium]
MGYEQATDIQAQTIPSILAGSDVTGKSSTGTGKTAAFALPIVQMCAENPDKSSVLILSPTRELAVQTAEEFRKFSKYVAGVPTVTVYGGAPMDSQIRGLRTAKIVIGTPGRIMDHLRRKTLKLDNLKMLV